MSCLTIMNFKIICSLITYCHGYENLSRGRNGILYDGNKTTTTDGDLSICHGTQHIDNVTWYIDFTTLKSIYRLTVSGEVTHKVPSGQLSVYISNSSSWTTGFLCAKLKKNTNRQFYLNTTCARHGRYVVIHFDGNTDLAQSEKSSRTKSDWFFICETRIEGCHAGVFGENCNKNCSKHCIGKNCDILDGRCLSTMCSDGWQGEGCNRRCSNRTYGHQCQSTCGKCANFSDCHHVTGYCAEGCVDGWEGYICDKGCDAGVFGENCNKNYSKHCIGKNCDILDGRCLSTMCPAGWQAVGCKK